MEVREEVNRMIGESLLPKRKVTAVVGKVTLGAWAHGRSSSCLVNGIQGRGAGWRALGRKSLSNYWTRPKTDPADDPSRFVYTPAPDWVLPLI